MSNETPTQALERMLKEAGAKFDDNIETTKKIDNYKQIFFSKIKKYDEREQRKDHYIKINDNVLMVITWNHKWDYGIYDLEEISD